MTLYEHLILKEYIKGFEQGLKQGFQKGYVLGQHKKAVNVVKKGWQHELSIDILVDLSGLPDAEVLHIITDIEKETNSKD